MGRRSSSAAGQPEVGEVEGHPEVTSKCRKEGKFSSCCPRDSLGESLFVIQACCILKVGVSLCLVV